MKKMIFILIALGLGTAVLVNARSSKPKVQLPSTSQQQSSVAANDIKESKNGEPIVINYSDKGFDQPEMKIRAGTTVKWTNQRLNGADKGRPMWVASDIHPTHTIYPEFDQARPLGYEPAPTDSTYEFTFSKPGKWEYHDHYDPGMKGAVIVN